MKLASYCTVIDKLLPSSCPSFQQVIPKILPRYSQVIPKLFPGFPQVTWLQKSYTRGVGVDGCVGVWVVLVKDKDGTEPIN